MGLFVGFRGEIHECVKSRVYPFSREGHSPVYCNNWTKGDPKALRNIGFMTRIDAKTGDHSPGQVSVIRNRAVNNSYAAEYTQIQINSRTGNAYYAEYMPYNAQYTHKIRKRGNFDPKMPLLTQSEPTATAASVPAMQGRAGCTDTGEAAAPQGDRRYPRRERPACVVRNCRHENASRSTCGS